MSKNHLKFIDYLTQYFKSKIITKYSFFKLQKNYPSLCIEENVQIKNPNKLTVGKNVIIQKGSILHCGGMSWSNYKGYIKIGDDSVISPYCVFYGAGGIEVGERFDCAPCVMIFSSRSNYGSNIIGKKEIKRYFKEVIIGNDVILFAGVIINLGVIIGDGAVIAAGSVVLSNVPPKEVWGGIPAKFIKKRI